MGFYHNTNNFICNNNYTGTIYFLKLDKKLKESQELQLNSSQNADTALIIQFIVITILNFLSWFLANGIYTGAMFLSTYPGDLIMWTVITGLPTNSIINPSVLSSNKF